jgi:hypothetical protein
MDSALSADKDTAMVAFTFHKRRSADRSGTGGQSARFIRMLEGIAARGIDPDRTSRVRNVSHTAARGVACGAADTMSAETVSVRRRVHGSHDGRRHARHETRRLSRKEMMSS